MTKQLRSADYIDGLQVAFKAVFKLQEKAIHPDYKRAYSAALAAIDSCINRAVDDNASRIIIP